MGSVPLPPMPRSGGPQPGAPEPAAPQPAALEDIELGLLVEGLYRARGDDLRGYRPAVLKARLDVFMAAHGLRTISAVQERALHEEAVGEALVAALYPRPAAMFDDTAYHAALRRLVACDLRTWPHPDIWLPECAGAEEVHALAILLEEEGLYDRSRIFVTHANGAVLQELRNGGVPVARMAEYEGNHRRAGGKRPLAAYCEYRGDTFMISPSLRHNIVWAQSDLSIDASFNEFQLVLCRYAMAEFGSALRRKALRTFDDSLSAFGILGIPPDSQTDLHLIGHYQAIAPALGLHRRLG